jgi:hypothetical protein
VPPVVVQPPGVRREVFLLEDGEVALSFPDSLRNAIVPEEELDRLRAWLDLVGPKLLALAAAPPREPHPPAAGGGRDS